MNNFYLALARISHISNGRKKISNFYDANIIPGDYGEWKHCITVKCGIPLTREFIAARIASLKDTNNHNTKQFIQTYGEKHAGQVIAWFMLARDELENKQTDL